MDQPVNQYCFDPKTAINVAPDSTVTQRGRQDAHMWAAQMPLKHTLAHRQDSAQVPDAMNAARM